MSILMGQAPRHPGLWTDTTINKQALPDVSISNIASYSYGRDELIELAPKLAQLSHIGRWIVLINAPNIDFKQILTAAGVRMDRILLVKTKDEIETLWAAEKALTNGASSAVISWVDSLDKRDNRRLQLVTKASQAMGVIFETSKSVSNMNHLSQAVH